MRIEQWTDVNGATQSATYIEPRHQRTDRTKCLSCDRISHQRRHDGTRFCTNNKCTANQGEIT